tara:strand:+ start:42 stop:257 length:216 start_codon:yes stop_codon:yes gene_type:complete
MTQMNSVLNHLKDHNHINTWIAFTEYKCTRLADVIFKLKKKGVVIDTEMKYNEKTKTKWAQYNLISLGLKA